MITKLLSVALLTISLAGCLPTKTYHETGPIPAPEGFIAYCQRHPTAIECRS